MQEEGLLWGRIFHGQIVCWQTVCGLTFCLRKDFGTLSSGVEAKTRGWRTQGSVEMKARDASVPSWDVQVATVHGGGGLQACLPGPEPY